MKIYRGSKSLYIAYKFLTTIIKSRIKKNKIQISTNVDSEKRMILFVVKQITDYCFQGEIYGPNYPYCLITDNLVTIATIYCIFGGLVG